MGAHHGPSGTAELQLGIRYADSFPTTANAELELGDPRTGRLTTEDAELELGGPRAGHLTTEDDELELGGPRTGGPRGSENSQ